MKTLRIIFDAGMCFFGYDKEALEEEKQSDNDGLEATLGLPKFLFGAAAFTGLLLLVRDIANGETSGEEVFIHLAILILSLIFRGFMEG